MRKVYFDKTAITECTSVWVKDAEVIWAGATVYSMPVKHKNQEYQRFADEYDIHFIFDDKIPVLDFYTVPLVEIFAIMSEALDAVLKYLFQEVNMHRIMAKHDVDNPASGKVMQKCNMTYEGTFRKFYLHEDGTYSDSLIYGILNEEY